MQDCVDLWAERCGADVEPYENTNRVFVVDDEALGLEWEASREVAKSRDPRKMTPDVENEPSDSISPRKQYAIHDRLEIRTPRLTNA